jgi:hypothetical protein
MSTEIIPIHPLQDIQELANKLPDAQGISDYIITSPRLQEVIKTVYRILG